MSKNTPGPVANAFEIWCLYANLAKREWKAGRELSPELARKVVESAGLVLRAYHRPDNFDAKKRPIENLPPEIAQTIASQIDYILAGKLPEPLSNLIRPGAPAIGPSERRDRALAVSYIMLCKSGHVRNPAHTRYIAELYGVDDSTVRRWQKEFAGSEPSDLFSGTNHNEIATRIGPAVEAAALRFRQRGHSGKGRVEFPRPGKDKPRGVQNS